MSASWGRAAPRGPLRQSCGHRRCTWAWRAGIVSLCGAWGWMILMILAPGWRPAVAFGACALTGFGALGITCPPDRAPPGDPGIEALMDATRETRARLPRKWTAADWAELEKELNR